MEDVRQQALGLLESHGRQLLRLLARMTLRREVAEDLFQDLLVKLVESPGWTEAKDPVPYVFRMAINLANQWRRSERRRARLHVPREAGAAEAVDRNAVPLVGLVEREELERVLDAMDELPETMRDCLILRYLNEETPESISRQLGTNAHHVRSICSKGLAALRKRLGVKQERDLE